MNATAAVLLVTWIIPGQPPGEPQVINSYQSSFESVETCENTRTSILQDAQRINNELKAKWTPVVGATIAATLSVSVSAVCTGSESETYTGTRVQTLAHEAYKWARVAAELGDARAQAQVGADLVAREELRWMSDSDEGLKWLNRSAQHGCFDAFVYLSLIYRDGVSSSRLNGNVSQNYVEALKWLLVAMSRRDVKQCNMFYDFYHGGPRNPADRDRDPLREQYDQIVGKMTPDQIAEAQKLGRAWRPVDLADQQAWDRNEVTNGTPERP
jgi:hypothetical protein